ncbi:MAG: hypothetical protein OEV23_02695 [Gallionella sp.]|nr:hypothetical protein [Gallionella sp.]
MRTLKLLLAGLFSVAVAACGGGGSSSAPPAPFSATTAGVAAKGIIKFATVTAYELNASGVSVRTVGTSETDASGKYSLTIGSSYTGGPLKLVLTAKNDNSTKMVCDVSTGCGAGVAFGQDYTLPLNFTLVAYQQAASSGSTVKTQITPYSNMAAARVQAQIDAGGTLDNSLVAAATSEVSQIVGVNIAITEPVDITNPLAVAAAGADALQYAAFNAGVGNIAFDPIYAASGIQAGIAAVADSFADGQFDSSDAVQITQVVSAVTAEVTALSTANPTLNTTTLTATLTTITSSTSGGVYNPEPPPAATLTAVAQARGLVSQTRTWGTSLAALQTPASAFALDIDTAGAVLNSTSGSLGGVFGIVLEGAIGQVGIEVASANGLQAQSYNYPITYWTAAGPVSGVGAVTVINNGGTLNLSISAPSLAGVTTSGTVTTNIPSTILSVPAATLDVASLTMNVTGSASVTSPSAASLTLNNTAFNIALKAGKTSATATSADIASVGLNGGLSMQASGVTFTGTGKFTLVANSVASPVEPLSLEEIAVSGTFTGSKGSVNASASVKFNNAATFDSIGLLSHQPVLWAYDWQPADIGLAAAYATATGDTLKSLYYDQYSNQTCVYGYALNISGSCVAGDTYGAAGKVLTAFSTRYSNPVPSSVQNVYVSYYNGDGSTLGTAYGAMLTFPDFESASQFANATITVSSNVALTGYPAANLTVTANRTAYGSTTVPIVGNAVAILSYSGQSVKFEVANTAVTPTTGTGTLTVTNPDGVKLVLNGTSTSGAASGTVSVNSTQVGTISSSNGMMQISYDDGTFESLN